MNARAMLQSAQRFFLANSPSILTAVGTIGVISTAVLATRAGYSSACLLSEARQPYYRGDEPDLEKREVLELVWKEFIPPAIVGAVTLTAIIGANHISTRRAAAVAAAFKISERMAEEYRQKVLEHIGPQKEEMVRSAVAKDRIERVEDVSSLVITGSEELYFDAWSGRVFVSTREKVEQAINQINYQINQNWTASLSELYDLWGLPHTALSDDFGWNSDELIEPYYTSTLIDGRRAAVEIRFNTQPFANFSKIGI